MNTILQLGILVLTTQGKSMINNKITIALADSDSDFLTRLNERIDWEHHGYFPVGTAADEEEIMHLLETQKPDLLFISRNMLTDECIDRFRNADPLVRFVVFMEPGEKKTELPATIAYMVKPLSLSRVTAELNKIYYQITNSNVPVTYGDRNEHDLSITIFSLLMNIFEEPVSEEEMIAELSLYGFEFEDGYQLRVLATYCADHRLMLREMVDRINSIIRKYYFCGSFILGNRIISLLMSNDDFMQMDNVVTEIRDAVSGRTGGECTIAISRPFQKTNSLIPSCFEAVDATKRNSHAELLRQTESNDGVVLGEMRKAAEFDKMLIATDREELARYLSEILQNEISEMGVLQILMTASSVFSASLGEAEMERLLRIHQLVNPMSDAGNLELVKQRIMYFCLAGNELLVRRKQRDGEQMVNRTISMIEHYYMEASLSLNNISRHLHITPNYLSSLIKKYSGETFSNLLIGKRMEVARNLLENSNLKVSEIAEKCGYSDQHYFSYSFKNFYGISPLKMRKNNNDKKGNA